MQCGYAGENRMIHILNGTKLDAVRFYPANPDAKQFKIYKLFIYVMFHLIFSKHG